MEIIIIKIDGMMCGMCESHLNKIIRKEFKVKKVTSSYKKNRTEVITDNQIDEDSLKTVIDATGYKVISILTKPYEKKSFFTSLHPK